MTSAARSSQALFDLAGRTALVTGSSRGIGFALAAALARAGAEVILNGRDPATVDDAVARMADQGLAIAASTFDVTDREGTQRAVERIEAQRPIDILVNCAGLQHRAPLESFPEAEWRRLMDVNVGGVFLVSQVVARAMLARGAGKVVNVCSVQSELARPGIGPYAASKGAVKMLTKAMCAEWAPRGLQINGLAPGYFATALTRSLVEDRDFTAWLTARTPAGRWGEVSELGGACVFLCSRASDFVNGHILYVDGGMTSVV